MLNVCQLRRYKRPDINTDIKLDDSPTIDEALELIKPELEDIKIKHRESSRKWNRKYYDIEKYKEWRKKYNELYYLNNYKKLQECKRKKVSNGN